jgi:hypothetical protein
VAEPVDTSQFFDQHVLQLEYFKRQRFAYEHYFDDGLVSKYRCYPVIVHALKSIHGYRPEHAKSFAKRFKASANDLRSCDGIVSEALVYSHYVPLIDAGLVRSVNLCKDDFDLKISRPDSTDAYLEVFCINPEYIKDENGVFDVRTHTQRAFASVRQKLMRKIQKQNQMQKARENWAVIELNDTGIAGDFTVAASLSDGYKLVIDRISMQVIDRGFDWSQSVFDAPETQYLHGVINFDLGYYGARRYILNTRVSGLTDLSPDYVP